MSVPNLNLLAGLEVAEKFVIERWVGSKWVLMSNLNPSLL